MYFFYGCAPDDDLVCLDLSTPPRCRSGFRRHKLVNASVLICYQDRELDANKTDNVMLKVKLELNLILPNTWFEKVFRKLFRVDACNC